MPIGRRPINDWPHLIGKEWGELVAREIQDFFSRISASMGGLPAGFNGISGSPLAPGTSGSPGDDESGWAAADHSHPSGLSAKGDSVTFDGEFVVTETVGAQDTVLTADNTSATGRSWKLPPSLGTPDGSTERLETTVIRTSMESYAVRDMITKAYR